MDADGQSDVASNLGLAGYHYDAATGYYHVRNRFYRADMAVWLSRDPNPAGIYNDGGNLYLYVRGNPVNWTDPWGLQAATTDLRSLYEQLDDLEARKNYDYKMNGGQPGPHSAYLWAEILKIKRAINAILHDGSSSNSVSGGTGVSQFLGGGALLLYSFADTRMFYALANNLRVDGSIRSQATAFGKEMANRYENCDRQGTGNSVKEAARHILWQALLTYHYGEDNARGIGNVHELGASDSPDTARDQKNNVIGRAIGSTAQRPQEIEHRVEEAIRRGWFYVVTRDGDIVEACPCQ